MAFFGLFFLGAFVGGLALVVFVCALPFLLRPDHRDNRFGDMSQTRSIPGAVVSGFRHAIDFSGRANPMDFWFFAICVAGLCGTAFATTIACAILARDHPTWWSAAPLLIIPVLGVPSLSMAVRRLHDINKSGWWLLLLLAFGYFVLIYWFFQPSQKDVAHYTEVFN